MPMFLFCKHSFEYSVLIIKSANEYKKNVSNQLTVILYLEIQLLKSMILQTCDFPDGFNVNRPRLLNCNSQQTS